MPHIELQDGVAGMRALQTFRPETAAPLNSAGEHFVARARGDGATDLEIHDTVLIAAAFCMDSRYVDGLATWAPDDPEFYRQRGEHLARQGYSSPR